MIKLLSYFSIIFLWSCNHSSPSGSKKYSFIKQSQTSAHYKAGSLFQITSKHESIGNSTNLKFTVQSHQAMKNVQYKIILPEGVTLFSGSPEQSFAIDPNQPKGFEFSVRNLSENQNVIFHVYRWENSEKRGTPFLWNLKMVNQDISTASKVNGKARRDRFKKLIY